MVVVTVVVTGAAVVTGVDTAVVVGVVTAATVVVVAAAAVVVVAAAVVAGAAVVTVTVPFAFKPEVRLSETNLVGLAELFNQQALAVLTKVQDWQPG